MIILVHKAKRMTNGQMLHQFNIFPVVLTKQIFLVSNIYQKLDSVICIFLNMST